MAFSFDERGNPTTYEYGPSSGCSGRRGTVTNADGVVLDYQEWLYDERDRLTDHLTPRGDLSYTYDASGNLKSVDSGNVNGVELAYDYDVLNRLETVYDAGAAQPALEHDYGYDDVGNLQSLAYANGVTHTWTYNSLNRLTNLVQSSGSGTLYGYTYELRDSGHRSRQTETSGRVVDYTYDNLYRLTSEAITNDPFAVNGVSSWTYDDVGNRLTQTSTLPDIAAQNETYSDNDWLDGTIYDDNGNTTLEDGDADVYDFMNRLVRRTTSGGAVIDITYDADGNRITKSAPAGVTHYLVDMNNLTGYAQVLEELDSTLTTERVYTYGLDLIAQHQLMPVDAPTGWETSYYLYDGLGTVRALADENGLISDAYTYDAWGNLINVQGLTPNSYLYTGEQWDHDLGMYFLRARYMNPETGRFHTLDTYEGRSTDPHTLHKYLYGNANPMSYIDPSGNFSLPSLSAAMGVLSKVMSMAVPAINVAWRVAGFIDTFILIKDIVSALQNGAIKTYVNNFSNTVNNSTGGSYDLKKLRAMNSDHILDIMGAIAPRIPDIVKLINKHHTSLIRRAVKNANRSRFVIYLPSLPGNFSKGPSDSSLPLKVPLRVWKFKVQAVAGSEGGRLLGFGIKSGGKPTQQIFRVDYHGRRKGNHPAPYTHYFQAGPKILNETFSPWFHYHVVK
ncbi:RHS repeat domain-containing protein [Cerasicoccus fimbriatus]|uniref:RHS repeat domain-containing protein n=1 Tax=Cerasicoccus fimbriatus TaxID=3014554 RepID=UPI0022B30ACC|nr:RHS repeat-associated core domain-containing protein [Cerasicoccus sp. TK19100]